MKCPYCNKEMTKGYIQCRDGVVWTEKKQWVAALSCLGKGAFYLENIPENGNRAVYAYRCEDCEVVLIPYGKQCAEE